MNHLTDEQIERIAFGGIDEADEARLAEHLDECRQCTARYVALLMPSVRHEQRLTAARTEELFDRVCSAVEPRHRVLSFPTALRRTAAGLALAAGVLLAFLFTYDSSDPAPAIQPVAGSDGERDAVQDPAVRLIAIEGGVKVNGTAYTTPATFAAPMVAIGTGRAERARFELASTASIEVGEGTRLSLDGVGSDTVTATLAEGSIQTRWDRSSGRELFVTVPGGRYHVVGTIFRISVDSMGSRIAVTTGAVAFLPDRARAGADTVRSGASRAYSLEGMAVLSRGEGDDVSVARRKDASMAGELLGDVGDERSEAADSAPPAVSTNEFFAGEDADEDAGGVRYTAIQKAKILRQLGRPDEAIEVLRPLVAKPGAASKAHIGLAQAFEMMGQVDSAMHHYRIATDVRGPRQQRAIAWLHIGRLAHKSGVPEKSAPAYRSYLDMAPEGVHRNEAFEKLYRHFLHEDNTERLIAVVREWVDEAPELDHPVYLLATAYHSRGDYRYALRFYETYIMKYPEGAEREAAMYYAADCSRRLGEGDAYAEKAQRYKNHYPDGRFIEMVERD